MSAPAAPRAPAASVARLRRDGGGGVGASRAGRGGAAPPRLPRDGRALGAGNEEAAGGGSGGGAAAGTRARLPPGGLGEPPRARPLALPGQGKSSRRASLPRSWPRSSALRPLPGRSAPHAQIYLLRRPRQRIPAAGTRAGCRPTRTCCWRLPGSPAATHPHPGREGAAGKGSWWSGEGTDPVPRIRAGAPRRRAPLTLGLTRQPRVLSPGSHRAAAQASSALGGVGAGTGRVRAAGVGRSAAPRDAGVEPSPPGREQGRCEFSLAGVEGQGTNCGADGGNACPLSVPPAQTSAVSVQAGSAWTEILCPFFSSALPPIPLCSQLQKPREQDRVGGVCREYFFRGVIRSFTQQTSASKPGTGSHPWHLPVLC